MKLPFSSWPEYTGSKIHSEENLLPILHENRQQGKKIATLNGSFDLLHAGHLYILYEAAQTADILVVALNSDLSVRQYKSTLRPIITLEHRMEMISALTMVDFVTWFDEPDPRRLLQKIRPDVHVNGAEYGHNCIEAEVVRECGGRLHLIPRIPGLATSDILSKVQQLCALSSSNAP